MTFVEWKQPVEIVLNDESLSQLSLAILSQDSNVPRWQGSVVRKKSSATFPYVRVQLRNSFAGTNILIDIGVKPEHTGAYRALPVNKLISISANGRMHFTLEEISSMNCAIAEATGVYRWVITNEPSS